MAKLRGFSARIRGGASALPWGAGRIYRNAASAEAGAAGAGEAAAAAAAAAAAGSGEKGAGDKGGKKGAAAIAAAAAGAAGEAAAGAAAAAAGAFNGTFDLSLLPENLRGATAEETLHKLFPAFKGYRDAQARAGSVPAKPDAYPVPELADDAKPFFPELEKDEVFTLVRAAAHKHGIPAEQFKGLFGEVLNGLAKSGMLQPLVDPKAEFQKLGGTPEAAREAQAVVDFIARQKTLHTSSKGKDGLPPDLTDELDLIAGTANGIRLVKWFMGKTGEQGVDISGAAGSSDTWTRETIKEAMRDPRYRTDNPKHDPAFRLRVDEANKALHTRT